MGEGDQIGTREPAEQIEPVSVLEALPEDEAGAGHGEQWLELLEQDGCVGPVVCEREREQQRR